MMTCTFLDFQAAAQKRQIAQKEDAGCCVSVRVTAADAHYWLRTIKKDACTQEKVSGLRA